MVLWSGAFGMKILDFLKCLPFSGEFGAWFQVIFAVLPCPLEYQWMLSLGDFYVVWNLLYWAKWGRSVIFPASIWGHCSQVLVFASTWDTQEGVWEWHFSCCFSQHLGIFGPPNAVKQGKMQNDTEPPPPHWNPLWGHRSYVLVSCQGVILLAPKTLHTEKYLLGNSFV